MRRESILQLTPEESGDDFLVRSRLAQEAGVKPSSVTGFYRVKQSIDARGRQVFYRTVFQVFIDEPAESRPTFQPRYPVLKKDAPVAIIAGAGPAGLFAALKLIELGVRPLILERGKDVRARRRDLAALNRQGDVNPESNYCFGEGGAGTYSDGKLYTRSGKRGDADRVLQLFVHFGADESILYDAHPHIGTNKLPGIITAMREQIEASGGQVRFNTRLADLAIEKSALKSVNTASGEAIPCAALILATGHSARDIFNLLAERGIEIGQKPFALGVRAEHPQALIDQARYRGRADGLLPPASYQLVEQVNDKGVFSFCMCPGGIIAPAATAPGEIVVNGWSPSKRNNPFANSGMVVQVEPADAFDYLKKAGREPDGKDPLLLLKFQQEVEQHCFRAGGSAGQAAPAQRMTDFATGKSSSTLPVSSYVPGLKTASLHEVLPTFIASRLRKAFPLFGKKIPGYYSEDAVLVGTESRTSSPVRIPRDREKLHHPQVSNLFPCGEGAGYAGGIVSAAMDGENIAARVAALLV